MLLTADLDHDMLEGDILKKTPRIKHKHPFSVLKQRLQGPAQAIQKRLPFVSKTPKKCKIRKRYIVLAVVVLAGGGFFAFKKLTSPSEEAAQSYTETEVSRQTVQRTLSSTGTLEPANQYNVTSSVQGEVLSCTFEEGDIVTQGQTLYEIDKTDMENSISRAQLSLQQS